MAATTSPQAPTAEPGGAAAATPAARRWLAVTKEVRLATRAEWRAWLDARHADGTTTEAWLIRTDPDFTYLDSVEEALCFGWIDGLAKKNAAGEKAQRFTPRRRRGSHWTALNVARVARLRRLGLLTPAGEAALPPDADAPLVVPEALLAVLRACPETWANYQRQPELYQRVRLSYILECKAGSEDYVKRLNNFVKMTKQGKLFGNWNDKGRLLDGG